MGKKNCVRTCLYRLFRHGAIVECGEPELDWVENARGRSRADSSLRLNNHRRGAKKAVNARRRSCEFSPLFNMSQPRFRSGSKKIGSISSV